MMLTMRYYLDADICLREDFFLNPTVIKIKINTESVCIITVIIYNKKGAANGKFLFKSYLLTWP